MSDLSQKEQAVINAVMDLLGETRAAAACLPIPGTNPKLWIMAGESSDIRRDVDDVELRDSRSELYGELCAAKDQVSSLTQQLAAANERVENKSKVIAEALHELDSSAVTWDSPVLRASQLLQVEHDTALSNLPEDDEVVMRTTGDHLCEHKTQDIMSRGYKRCGYVLMNDAGHCCIINGAAVRWLTKDECWQLMHPDADTIPVPRAEYEAMKMDSERLNSGCIMTSEWDEFGEPFKCERRGLDLRADIDAATAASKGQGTGT
jgi:hypothetical protein